MPIVPNLNTYSIQDDDYVVKWNADMQAIISSLTEVEVALDVAFQGTSFLFGADWGRRIVSGSGGDPRNGVIGAYSLVFENDDVNDQFILAANNADLVSPAILTGIRKQISGDLVGDLTLLTLSDGDYVVFAGVDSLGVIGFDIGFSLSEGDIELALYQFDLNVDTAATQVFTITNVQRTQRSLLFDNTWLQLEQERLRPFEFQWHEATSTPPSLFISVPYDHVLVSTTILVSSSDSSASAAWNVKIGTQNVAVLAWDDDDTGDDPGVLKRIGVVASQVGRVELADTVYELEFIGGVGAIDSAVVTLEVVPSYNVPVI